MGTAPNKVRYYTGIPAQGEGPVFALFSGSNAVAGPGGGPAGSQTVLSTGPATNGTLVEGVIFRADRSNDACRILVWYKNNASGIWSLVGDIAVPATTQSASVAGPQVAWVPDVKPFVMANGDSLAFETTDATANWYGTVVGGGLDVSSSDPGQTHPL
jgi:hypothetical protein